MAEAPRRVMVLDDWSKVSDKQIEDLVNDDSVFVTNLENTRDMPPPTCCPPTSPPTAITPNGQLTRGLW